MPICHQQHRLATGRSLFIQIDIIRKKTVAVTPAGVLLLWKGCGQMERHLIIVGIACELFCTKTVTYKRSDESHGRPGRFGVTTAIAVVFMSCLLLLCGDVESNPGPNTPVKHPTESGPRGSGALEAAGGEVLDTHMQRDQPNSPPSHQGIHLSIRDSIMEAMREATKELKNEQAKENEVARARAETQTTRLESSMKDMRDSLSSQLGRVETTQREMNREVTKLRTKCDVLQKENTNLQKQLREMMNKFDSLENHSRRNNLLFFGIKREGGRNENWDDCEEKVLTVIREGMGIEETIDIERAHRSGKGEAIVVKLLSFKQKNLILKNAKKLKSCETYQNVYVREDFSLEVRKKRQGLKEKSRQLYEAGQKPRMKFDKLISQEGVFTFDTEKAEVVKLSERGGNRNEHQEETETETREQYIDAEDREVWEEGDESRAEPPRHWQSWDLDPFGFPPLHALGNHRIRNDHFADSRDSIVSTEDAEPNHPNDRFDPKMTKQGGFPTSQPEDARSTRRLSNIPMPTRSPMKTRNRMRAASLSRPNYKDNSQTNTLQTWVKSNTSKQDQSIGRGGRGGQAGGRGGRGSGRGVAGRGAGGGESEKRKK